MSILDQMMQDAGTQPAQSSIMDKMMADAQSTVPVSAPISSNPPSFMTSFGRGVKDVEDAGAQMLVHALPSGAVNAVNSATKYVNDLPIIGPATKALGMTPATSQQLDSNISNAEKQYQQSRSSNGIDWGRMAGNITATAPAAFAMPAVEGMGANAALGSLYSGLSQPVTSGDYATELAKKMGIGAVAGGASSAVISGLSKAISPKVSNDVQTLLDNGVTPTPGQIMGGTAKRLEDSATSVPVLGDVIKNAQRRASGDVQTAAYNRALNPIGESLPPKIAGRDAVVFTENKLKDAYNNVLDNIGAITPDQTFHANNGQLKSMVDNMSIPDTYKQKFAYELGKVKDAIDTNGVITSTGYKSLESTLGSDASSLGRSTDIYDNGLSQATKQLQANLRDMLQRQAGSNADDLSNVNSAWANFKRVQNAASKIGGESGDFTPAQLQNAVRALDKSKDKAAFARGNALMQDLSDPAKNVLGSSVPDSGTPLRSAVGASIGAIAGHSLLPEGMGAMIGPAALGIGAMAMPYTKIGQSLAARLLTQRPDFAPVVAQGVKSLSPYASIMGATLANRLNQ